MSREQAIILALRKARLLERIDAQRGQLAAYGALLEKPLAAADKAVNAGRYAKAHPWVAAVALLPLGLMGPRKLLRWAGRGWTVWRGVRFAQQWLHENGHLKNL